MHLGKSVKLLAVRETSHTGLWFCAFFFSFHIHSEQRSVYLEAVFLQLSHWERRRALCTPPLSHSLCSWVTSSSFWNNNLFNLSCPWMFVGVSTCLTLVLLIFRFLKRSWTNSIPKQNPCLLSTFQWLVRHISDAYHPGLWAFASPEFYVRKVLLLFLTTASCLLNRKAPRQWVFWGIQDTVALYILVCLFHFLCNECSRCQKYASGEDFEELFPKYMFSI